MCFLKHIKHIEHTLPHRGSPSKMDKNQSDTEVLNSQQILSNYESKSPLVHKFDREYFLMSCLGLMQMNSTLINNLNQKIETAGTLLTGSFTALPPQPLQTMPSLSSLQIQIHQNLPEKDEQSCQTTTDGLTRKLFGAQQYKYRLELSRQFPDVLFKERNFAFGVKLVEIASGKEERNGNLMNISVGLCDKQGEWIHETKDGVPFIKGKAETELYHGEGEFCKLAPRDVSRGFQDKVVNLVVYCKASLLRYSGESSLEESIDFQSVEPLVVRDITIKAKKRD